MIYPQEIAPSLNLTDEDISDTIDCLKTNNPSRTVEFYRKKMSAQVIDEKVRNAILTSLPKGLYDLQIHIPELETKIREFIKPVAGLYDRERYSIMIIRTDVPFIMLDAGVLLVISTGVLDQAESDDEILGYIAHEVGHDFYSDYSVYTKHLYKILKTGGNEPALARRFVDVLALLELQCDAFSAVTLSHLGYDPTAFISGIERSSKKYRADIDAFHPAAEIRKKVVEGVVSKEFVNPGKRRRSPLLKEIKTLTKPKPVILRPLL